MTPADSDVGVFLEFLQRQGLEQTIRSLRQLTASLTATGLIPMEFNLQFVRPRDAKSRLRELQDLQQDAIELMHESERNLGLSVGHQDQAAPHTLASLAYQNPADRLLMKNRAVRYFKETLAHAAPELELSGKPLSTEDFLARLSLFFYSRIEKQCEILFGLVRNGYKDPIRLPSDNVVNLRLSETSPNFRAPLSVVQQQWLFDPKADRVPLIEHWRLAVRADYEAHNRSPGAAGES